MKGVIMFHWGIHTYYGYGFGPSPTMLLWLLPFGIWALAWEGLALWVTARRRQWGWFVFFLFVHTAGVAEIIYLLMTNGFDEFKKK